MVRFFLSLEERLNIGLSLLTTWVWYQQLTKLVAPECNAANVSNTDLEKAHLSNYEEPIQTFCLDQIWVYSQQGVPIVPECWINWAFLALSPVSNMKKKKKKRKNYLDISFFYTMCLTTLCSWIFNKLTMKLGSLTKQKRSSCLLWFITTLPTKYYFGYNIVGMANSTYFH